MRPYIGTMIEHSGLGLGAPKTVSRRSRGAPSRAALMASSGGPSTVSKAGAISSAVRCTASSTRRKAAMPRHVGAGNRL